ncbi:MAG: PH domain-containing protein [Acidimicrobiales bacterium]
MSYPKELLHEYEELILDLHPHWWMLVKGIAPLVGSVILGIIVLGFNWPDPVKLLVALLVLVGLVYFLRVFLTWASTDFVLTTDRVVYRSGIIAKRGIEIPLERINTIFFEQRIFERLLGLGDLQIESASKDGAQVFDDIRKPSAGQNEIYRQMELNDRRNFDRLGQQMAGATPAPAPAEAPPSIPQQIEHLSQLRDKGVLTDEEFQAKKAELLGRM